MGVHNKTHSTPISQQISQRSQNIEHDNKKYKKTTPKKNMYSIYKEKICLR